MLSSDLFNGYLATCYQIHEPAIDIYISKENSALDTFLIKHKYTSWCLITAWNPFSIAQTKEVNETLNEQLKADLSDYIVYDGEGKDTLGDWPPEVSFFVANISKEKTMELATKFKQNAVVYGEQNKTAELLVLV
jgi:hypothetical protein